MPPDSLETLAEALAGTFPAWDDGPLARSLMRELAIGEPVAPARYKDALARWPNVEYDEHGRVVAFSGLSLSPTAHRFIVAGRTLYTWGAWDTLFLPALIGRFADVRSRCAVTRTEVRLTVDPDGIRDADPADLRVSFPPPGATLTADIAGTFCCHVHFLADAPAAERWLTQHPDGIALGLDEAFELGRLATRNC